MKLLDIIKEELTQVTGEQKDNTRKIYKFLKTGTYRPYPDDNALKYVLPDFEDHIIFPSLFNDKVLIYLDFSKVKMYIVKDNKELVVIRRSGSEDSPVIRNIKHKIISKFKQHGVVLKDYHT